MSKRDASTTTSNGGIGVFGALGIVFVVLKLCGVIAWSWWWVTAPFWGGFAFFAAVLLGIGICVLFLAAVGR